MKNNLSLAPQAQQGGDQPDLRFIGTGSPMRDLVRDHDWSSTPLGPIGSWPASLRTAVGIVMNSPFPMFLWWGEDFVQIYNDGYLPFFGQGKHPRALGQLGRDCWPEIWHIVGSQIENVMCGQATEWQEDRLVPIFRNDRLEDVYWSYSYSPVHGEDGDVAAVLVVCTETTSTVLAKRRRASLDALHLRVQHCHTFDDVFAEARAIAAGNPRDIIGFDVCHGDAAPAPEGAVRIRDEKTRLTLTFEPSPRLPMDASYRAFLEQFTTALGSTMLRIEGELTLRLANDQRDRLLLDAPVGTAVLVGDDLRYELANAMYCQITGRTEEHFIGKPFAQVFPELVGSDVHQVFQQVYKDGTPYVSEATLVRVSFWDQPPEDRYYIFNLSPLRLLNGPVYGLMAIAIDVTQQVQGRNQIERLNADLHRAARTKDEFLAMLGHELRNPLAPIVTALNLMKMKDSNTRAEQAVIGRQVEHVVRLVDDLLDISRITSGKVELRKSTVVLADVLKKSIEMAGPLIEQKRHRLSVEIADVTWYGDPARLAQVVSNLLSNSARYTPAGGSIHLAARVDQRTITITVTDNGQGIAAARLPLVFDLFVQGEQDVDRAKGGLGIGLALVKNLVQMHEGSVRAESGGPGAGSTFTVTLPLVEAAQAAGARAVGPAAPRTEGSLDVLVVDDNRDAADSLAEFLRAKGHVVKVCYDPVDALLIAGDRMPDIAILDIGLPGIDGYELAQRLLALPREKEVRLVALTGYGRDEDKVQSALAGFHSHLVKPIDIDELENLMVR
ncbi:MAG TPA: ATP-binding protein [Telluria sp.]|nr:ATP-binding protein [Telluria sp.]